MRGFRRSRAANVCGDGKRVAGAMALSRTPYDEGAYRHELRESMGPAAYIFESKPTNEYTCDAGVRELQFSELQGLPRRLSRCPGDGYIPSASEASVCAPPGQMAFTPDFVRDEHTKLSNPPSSLRCKGVNRFAPLCEDPQRWALNPFHFAEQDNLNARDNHRPVVPRAVDAAIALPEPAGDLPPEVFTFMPTPTLPVLLPLAGAELDV